MNDKTEKVARQIEKVIHEFGGGGLHIDGGELRDILEEEFEKPMPDEVEKIIEHAALCLTGDGEVKRKVIRRAVEEAYEKGRDDEYERLRTTGQLTE